MARAGARPGDLVLDIGAGDGAVTAPLVDAGARVIAVVLHAGRAEQLRRRFAGAPVRVVEADAADLRLPRGPFLVVANPPFAITTALLRRLLSPRSRLLAAHLVVPVHVAARWSAGRGPAAAGWNIQTAGRLPCRAFTPPAPSPVAVLVVRRASHRPRRLA